MSKPNNSIANIKLPGENSQRPIVPYAVGYSSNNSYQATLPQLTWDTYFVITSQDQNISGVKRFNDDIVAETYVALYDDEYDEYVYLGHMLESFRWSTSAYNRSYQWYFDTNVPYFEYNYSGSGTNTYHFPTQSGTLSLQIDIVDLTSL